MTKTDIGIKVCGKLWRVLMHFLVCLQMEAIQVVIEYWIKESNKYYDQEFKTNLERIYMDKKTFSVLSCIGGKVHDVLRHVQQDPHRLMMCMDNVKEGLIHAQNMQKQETRLPPCQQCGHARNIVVLTSYNQHVLMEAEVIIECPCCNHEHLLVRW